MQPNILLINPWIYDFAAFDLWAKPLGLLYLAEALRKAGCRVRLVDCLDRLHPESGAPPRRAAWPKGAGQWARHNEDTPKPLDGIPRKYSRYGLPEEVLCRELVDGPRPDLVMVGSGMTYWYLGTKRAISLVKKIWPESPVILGGVYATLCRNHAERESGADLVVSGAGEAGLPGAAMEAAGIDLGPAFADDLLELLPALDLYREIDFAPLMTSRGCPRKCPYCASRQMYEGFVQRPVDDVIGEIEERCLKYGIEDFTFFDDALLVNEDDHIKPILEGILRRGLKTRFHVPNGLHVSLLEKELAELMFKTGFQTIRLGLETLDPNRRESLGYKVKTGQFEAALNNLVSAGFDPPQIGTYILYGLPGQPLDEALYTAKLVRSLGARPYLAEYSPLPGTPLWDEALNTTPFDLESEPLYQNNSFFPCRGYDFSWEKIWEIKRAALGRS